MKQTLIWLKQTLEADTCTVEANTLRLVPKIEIGGIGGHPLSTNAKFSEKLTFLTRTCAYQGGRNVSFSENLCTYLMDGPLAATVNDLESCRVFKTNHFHESFSSFKGIVMQIEKALINDRLCFFKSMLKISHSYSLYNFAVIYS